jgi:hypothetical protein
MDGIAPLFKAKRISCSFCVGNTGNFMLILRWIILNQDLTPPYFIKYRGAVSPIFTADIKPGQR